MQFIKLETNVENKILEIKVIENILFYTLFSAIKLRR
jgi:hypothetical protein